MYDIICVGTAAQDVFVSSDQARLIRFQDIDGEQVYLAYEYGAKVAVDHLFISTGGGASNTATAFGKLGLRAAIVCEVGMDDPADMVERALAARGVDTHMLVRNPDMSTGYSVILTGLTGDRSLPSARKCWLQENRKKIFCKGYPDRHSKLHLHRLHWLLQMPIRTKKPPLPYLPG